MKKHETVVIIILTALIAAGYWFFLFSAAGASIPPESKVKLAYESGVQLEDKIKEAKRVLTENLRAQGCQEVRIAIWREEEDIYIVARCRD